MFVCRGGKIIAVEKPSGDATWCADDWARAATLDAKWASQGVSVDERKRLVSCAVVYKKWPGTVFEESVMARLLELL